MTAYRLIQELSKYNPETEVQFFVSGKSKSNISLDMNVDGNHYTHDVEVETQVNDYFKFGEITNVQGENSIIIELR
jgi:hypothetical protein